MACYLGMENKILTSKFSTRIVFEDAINHCEINIGKTKKHS
jgi:tRNA(Arg) A34 adenosine deaminase TadA